MKGDRDVEAAITTATKINCHSNDHMYPHPHLQPLFLTKKDMGVRIHMIICTRQFLIESFFLLRHPHFKRVKNDHILAAYEALCPHHPYQCYDTVCI